MLLIIFIGVIYLVINYFIWSGAIHWFRNLSGALHKRWFSITFTVIYFFLATSIVTCLLFSTGGMKAAMKHISNVWVGTFIYVLLFLAVAAITTVILRKLKIIEKGQGQWRKFVIIRGATVIVLVIGFTLYGLAHMNNIQITTYDISIDKKWPGGKDMKIVMVADFHMGYSVGNPLMEQMVDKINAQDADIVFIAGDIFDNSYEALKEPEKTIEKFKTIKSKYGVYACYGNHDVTENLIGGFSMPSKNPMINTSQMNDFMKHSNITLLRDEVTEVAGINIVGRRDLDKPGNYSQVRLPLTDLTESLPKNKPMILLEHEPKDLQASADAGVDLEMAGHTHDGQIFPGNLFIDVFWENACGFVKKDDMNSVVTSGVGVWGPAMRVGTKSEIVVINTKFK
ncbi:MAG: metallophosphoesterase [Anaerovoracaceae bacterium]